MLSKFRLLLVVLLFTALALTACGGGQAAAPAAEAPVAEAPVLAEEEAPAEEAAPLADEAAPAEEEAPAEEAAPAAEAPAESATVTETEAVTEEAPAEEAAAEEAAPAGEVDSAAAVGDFLANIPEGFYSVGKVDAVKEVIASGEVALFDVREPSEYAEGHIEGAVNIPIRTLAQNLDKIPSDKPVIIYCASGHRAGMALASLRVLGYDNVRAFPGSMKAWNDAGEPVSTEAVEAVPAETPKDMDPALVAMVDGFLSNLPENLLSVGGVDKLAEAMDAGAFLVDVREPAEIEEGMITGAINIPIRELAARASEVPMDQPVIIYCASGHRAAMGTAALQMMGYSNVRSFPAGYGAWEAANAPESK